MTTFEKIKVLFFKTLGFISMFGLSSYLIYENFYDGTVTDKVELGMTFLIGMGLVLYLLFRWIMRMRNTKEIAHEVARNLGKPSQAVNPGLLEILNASLWIIPLLMLGWLEYLLGFYEANLYQVVLYLVGSIGLGFMFRVLAVTLEQNYLQDAERRKEDEFISRIKS